MSASHSSSPNKLLQSIIIIIALAIIYEFMPSAQTIVPSSFSFEKNIAELITGKKLITKNNSTGSSSEADMLNNNLQSGYVISKIVDGDTIDIKKLDTNQVTKVRLLGINTPESVDPRRPVECYGIEASNHLKDIASDASIYIETDATQDLYDKYGRLLAYVYLLDGQMLNRKMIADGYAYEYTFDKPYKYQNDFKDLEAFAKRESRGLWSASTCSGVK